MFHCFRSHFKAGVGIDTEARDSLDDRAHSIIHPVRASHLSKKFESWHLSKDGRVWHFNWQFAFWKQKFILFFIQLSESLWKLFTPCLFISEFNYTPNKIECKKPLNNSMTNSKLTFMVDDQSINPPFSDVTKIVNHNFSSGKPFSTSFLTQSKHI